MSWLVVFQSVGCNKVCDIVSRATEYHPPELPVTLAPDQPQNGNGNGFQATSSTSSLQDKAVTRLLGSWASSRCETRSYGVFLTRHFRFGGTVQDGGNRKLNWTARHRYFGDVLCRRSLYSVETTGTYTVDDEGGVGTAADGGVGIEEISDIFNIEFNVSNATLCCVQLIIYYSIR